jgi:hypothetical protein
VEPAAYLLRTVLSYAKVGGERTTCRGGLSSEAASRGISLLHLAHAPHSVYSNLCGMDHHFHTS